MKKHTCIIIEDEPLAMERTRGFVQRVPYLELKATFENSLEGLSFLNSQPVDILFLDINMDELSGIELLESIHIPSEVIFTTAYEKYALKGFDLNITDYLLKPFTFQRFLRAVSKAQENLAKYTHGSETEFIFVKTENRLEKITVSHILFIEGMRDYRRIHTHDKRVMTLQTFTELEQMLPSSQVCRVHKSFMVGLQQIESIERGRILIDKQRIPISNTYRETFFAQII
ncbi:MAG: response regulator transcription factor [Bacteroidota bacterium]